MRTTVFVSGVFGVCLAGSGFAQERFMSGQPAPQIEQALNAHTDTLGEAILAGGEPSFERVASVFVPLGRSRLNVGIAEHRDEIGVQWDGMIELQNAKLSFRVSDPPSPHGIEGAMTQSLLEGYIPVAVTRWRYEGLAYELEVFGHSEGMSPRDAFSVYAGLRAENPGQTDRTAHISVYSFPALGGPLPRFEFPVPAGRCGEMHFRIPWHVRVEQLVERISPEEYAEKRGKTREFWEALLSPGKCFRTPERRVNDAQLAWLMYNFLNVDAIDGRCEPHDGGRFYEEVYGYSAALYCHALSLYGFWAHAERYLKDLLHYQQRDGRFRTSYGTPDNGAMLYAIGQHYRLSRNKPWLMEMKPAAERCCQWIAQARAKTKTGVPQERPLTFGLLASGDKPYADYPGEVFSYYVDCYCWLGMREVGQAFMDAGLDAEGKRWLVEAGGYREDILRSMERAVVALDGCKALPIEPLTQRLIKQGGGDYYGLIAPMLLETGFFAPDDRRAEWITEPMERRGGLMLGMSRFADGIDHAYTYGYAMTKLRRGDADSFLLTFYASLAHGMDRNSYSSVEVNHAPAGVNDPTLPHLYSHTQQLRWLRNMLVMEEDDELRLAAGTPRAWLGGGDRVQVNGAPTLFGRVTFTLAGDTAGRTITASIKAIEQAGHALPARLTLCLRKPPYFGTLDRLSINGQAQAIPPGECVSLDPLLLREGAEIAAHYR